MGVNRLGIYTGYTGRFGIARAPHTALPPAFTCAVSLPSLVNYLWYYGSEQDEVLHEIPILTIQATNPATGKIAKKKQKPVTFFGCKRGMV